ncbi:MAG: hypothetical protein ABII27_05775 [bacterium]
MKAPQFEVVDLRKINTSDSSFLLDFPVIIDKAIKKFQGIIAFAPVFLFKRNDNKYTLICGSKQFFSLKSTNKKRINALVFKSRDFSKKEVLMFALYKKLENGLLNDIEKSLVLDKLKRIANLKRNEIFNQFLPILGLEQSEYVFKEYELLMNLEDPIKNHVANGMLPFRVGILLAKTEKEDRINIFKIISKFKLGYSKSIEIIELLEVISRKENKPISKIIQENNLKKLISNKKDGLADYKSLKQYLFGRANPITYRYNQNFKNILKELKLPQNVKLERSPWFETNQINLIMNFQNKQQLANSIQQLSDRLKADCFNKLCNMKLNDEN